MGRQETVTITMERWKKIKGYENYYEVSNCGRIKALPKIVNNNGGLMFRPEKFLTITNDKKGYCRVRVCVNYKHKTLSLHRAVAIAFIPNPQNLPEVNHKDGNKLNCYVDNLEWCTRNHNMQHAYDCGLHKGLKGIDNGRNKLSEIQIKEIRSKYIPRIYSMKMLGNEYGVTMANINNIINKKSWQHIY